MTVLVALVRDKKVVLAADKMASCYHWDYSVDKVSTHRKIHMAVCGSGRAAQIIQHYLQLPPRNEDHTDDSYVADICDAIRLLLKSKDCTAGVSLLVVGVGEKIYKIDTGWSFVSSDTFLADGCGIDLALGALEVLYHDKNLTVEEVATKAVGVAAKRSLFCGNGVDLKIIDLP